MSIRRLTLLTLACVLTVVSAGTVTAQENALTDRGRMEAALLFAFNWTSSDVDTTVSRTDDTPVNTVTTSLYANPAGYFGITVVKNLQVRLTVGYQKLKTTATQAVDPTDPNGTTKEAVEQDSNSALILVGAHYHIPISTTFALAIGAGLGGFFGTTTRPVDITGDGIDDSNPNTDNCTGAFVSQINFGVLGQPSSRLTFRAGLRFDAIVGNESESQFDPSRDFVNLQVGLEFTVGVRFGSEW